MIHVIVDPRTGIELDQVMQRTLGRKLRLINDLLGDSTDLGLAGALATGSCRCDAMTQLFRWRTEDETEKSLDAAR